LDLPLSSARPAMMGRGRDAIVDVGSGIGIQSVVGSMGYMGGASQSVLGLTPAQSSANLPVMESETEDVRGFGVGRGGDVPPPPPPLPARYGERVGSSRTKLAIK
jgi:hypothetical protein